MKRLASPDDVAAGCAKPLYRPARHGPGPGIVHLGIGAFHRAHQAVYTDAALAAEGGDWRIIGVSLRGTGVADALNPQHGLYTLIERSEAGNKARLIGSIAKVIAAVRDRPAVLAAMTDPAIRIVSLTVTEKAYGVDRQTGGIDESHPAIAADLAAPQSPTGALGLLVEALRLRRARGAPAFTALCCDNLPNNGELLKSGVVDFASRCDPDLAAWIAREVAFPSTMVDRITPAPNAKTLADAVALAGCEDQGAVETEPFSQWVIEDRFPMGRPAFEAGGALFVDDVAPYERMKLRMLNGAHSMLAYAGFLAGHAYVRDVIADEALGFLVERHMRAASATLRPLSGISFNDYAAALLARFRNPAIAHETWQIAMDGTEKLPQRLFEPAQHALDHGQDIRPFAFAVAAWMRYCLGRTDDGQIYALRDPRETEIAACLADSDDNAAALSDALHALPGLFPKSLIEAPSWRATVEKILTTMLRQGVAAAIRSEAATRRQPHPSAS